MKLFVLSTIFLSLLSAPAWSETTVTKDVQQLKAEAQKLKAQLQILEQRLDQSISPDDGRWVGNPSGLKGEAGAPGKSCVMVSGTTKIKCGDDPEVELKGAGGAPGKSCAMVPGTTRIKCGSDTEVDIKGYTGAPGAPGDSCTIDSAGILTCGDTSVNVRGPAGFQKCETVESAKVAWSGNSGTAPFADCNGTKTPTILTGGGCSALSEGTPVLQSFPIMTAPSLNRWQCIFGGKLGTIVYATAICCGR